MNEAHNKSTDNMESWVESDEWLEWYKLTPAQRWSESEKLLTFFLMAGGSFDAEPDTQSPFYFKAKQGEIPAHGRSGLRLIRRCGV